MSCAFFGDRAANFVPIVAILMTCRDKFVVAHTNQGCLYGVSGSFRDVNIDYL